MTLSSISYIVVSTEDYHDEYLNQPIKSVYKNCLSDSFEFEKESILIDIPTVITLSVALIFSGIKLSKYLYQ